MTEPKWIDEIKGNYEGYWLCYRGTNCEDRRIDMQNESALS
jgi:hypothetical protein